MICALLCAIKVK